MNITIYGKNNCPFCVRAKNWFKSRGLEYNYISLDEDKEARTLFEERFKANGFKTVPQIIIDGEHIGGYSELIESQFANNFDSENIF